MNVKQLLDLLETMDPSATVVLHTVPVNSPTIPTVLQAVVVAYDNADKSVFLTNALSDKAGNVITNGEPHAKRINIKTNGKTLLEISAEVQEELHASPAMQLDLYLEVARARGMFKKLDDLMKQ